MITLDVAKTIAKKEFPDFDIFSIKDIGDRWAFDFDASVPGVPIVCVDKLDGAVSWLTIPPLENLDIVDRGKLIYSAE